jgi:ABC-type nitrate/sulfonate/bicarbonate transport system ATPase subunit
MKDKPFRLERVSHSFGAVEVLRELSMEIARGEFVVVVGPSGCGKTTLLNVLSGYHRPLLGVIEREGHERMVYQQDGLFPWKTVSENIELGLRHIEDQREREPQIRELLALIRLDGFEHHYPHQLSGGMRQRVELARALAGDSETLLMDEPFSSLDYLARIRMRQELARILRERSRTVVLVTHDIQEAAQLADRVIVLTERPAQIRCEITIHAQRPRGLTHPEVVWAVDRLLTELGIQSEGEIIGAGPCQTNNEKE